MQELLLPTGGHQGKGQRRRDGVASICEMRKLLDKQDRLNPTQGHIYRTSVDSEAIFTKVREGKRLEMNEQGSL